MNAVFFKVHAPQPLLRCYHVAMKSPEIDMAIVDRVIQMAWEDRTPFESIKIQFGFDEQRVIELMRKHLKRTSFEMWRKRVTGRGTKHQSRREPEVTRFRSTNQRLR